MSKILRGSHSVCFDEDGSGIELSIGVTESHREDIVKPSSSAMKFSLGVSKPLREDSVKVFSAAMKFGVGVTESVTEDRITASSSVMYFDVGVTLPLGEDKVIASISEAENDVEITDVDCEAIAGFGLSVTYEGVKWKSLKICLSNVQIPQHLYPVWTLDYVMARGKAVATRK